MTKVRKLLPLFVFVTIIVIVIQLHVSGYGLKHFVGINGKKNVNSALPTLRNFMHKHSTVPNMWNDGKQDLGRDKQHTQYAQQVGRYNKNRFNNEYENHTSGILGRHLSLHNYNNMGGPQIQVPHAINENNNTDNFSDHHPKKIYHEVQSSFLEIDTCPACFGMSICDQFFSGHIKLDTETDGSARRKNVYFGFWEINHEAIYPDKPPLPVVVKRLYSDEEIDAFTNFVCHDNSDIGDERKKCDVRRRIMQTKLASPAALLVEYVRKELTKVAHDDMTPIGFAMCASQELLDNLTKMHDITEKTSEPSEKIAMLTTSFALNPEGLVIKFCREHIPELKKYIPAYYGECGRMVVIQSGGNILKDSLKESWLVRVDIAFQLLQMVEDFIMSSPYWMVLFFDIRYENLSVSHKGIVQLIDLEDVIVINRKEIKAMQNHRPTTLSSEPCNFECLFSIAKSVMKESVHQCGILSTVGPSMMYLMIFQKFLSDLDSTKHIRFFDVERKHQHHHPGGLLHDIPDKFKSKMSELLYEGVLESKAGGRMYAVRALKKLLNTIKSQEVNK